MIISMHVLVRDIISTSGERGSILFRRRGFLLSFSFFFMSVVSVLGESTSGNNVCQDISRGDGSSQQFSKWQNPLAGVTNNSGNPAYFNLAVDLPRDDAGTTEDSADPCYDPSLNMMCRPLRPEHSEYLNYCGAEYPSMALLQARVSQSKEDCLKSCAERNLLAEASDTGSSSGSAISPCYAATYRSSIEGEDGVCRLFGTAASECTDCARLTPPGYTGGPNVPGLDTLPGKMSGPFSSIKLYDFFWDTYWVAKEVAFADNFRGWSADDEEEGSGGSYPKCPVGSWPEAQLDVNVADWYI